MIRFVVITPLWALHSAIFALYNARQLWLQEKLLQSEKPLPAKGPKKKGAVQTTEKSKGRKAKEEPALLRSSSSEATVEKSGEVVEKSPSSNLNKKKKADRELEESHQDKSEADDSAAWYSVNRDHKSKTEKGKQKDTGVEALHTTQGSKPVTPRNSSMAQKVQT